MIIASLQRTDSLHSAGEPSTGAVPVAFAGPQHTLRVWGGAAQVAAGGEWIAVVDGFLNNTESLASVAGMSAAACRAAPAEAVVRAVQASGGDSDALNGLRGSFWLAIVHPASGTARLRGDRCGLYSVRYTRVPGGWAWSADHSPLIAWSGRRSLARETLPLVLHYRRLLGRRTIVEGIYESPPLCEVALTDTDTLRRWDPLTFAPEPPAEPLEAWVDRLDAALAAELGAVRQRHDRVGVLLSGGLDSALLAAYAMRAGFERVIAYTADIEGYPNTELERARRLAAHLGLEHRVVPVTNRTIGDRADDVIRRMQIMPRNHSDFVMDSLLAAAGQDVSSVLYGEAADTVFGPSATVLIGNVERKRRSIAWLPRPAQRVLADALDRSRDPLTRRAAMLLRYTAEERAMRVDLLDSRTPLHRLLPGSPVEPPEEQESIGPLDVTRESVVEWFQRRTIVGDCRIHWHAVQRMALPSGLAVDNPFIEDPVLNIGRRLPAAYKRLGNQSKPVVRALARRHTPPGYVDLPKLGFPVPAGAWLRGPLQHWVDAVRRPDARVWSYLDRGAFLALSGRADLEPIWTIATLERFIRLFLDPDGA